MSNYLISGGAGFIGSNIAKALIEQGNNVVILDNLATGKKENIAHLLNSSSFKFIEGDIRDHDLLFNICKNIDFILHQAALPSVSRSIEDPYTSNDVNVNGTLNILKVAIERKVKRVVYAASSSAYGDTPTLPKEEKMSPRPKSPYAVSKLTGEYYCQCFSNVYGLQTVCLRYFNVFGPNQDPFSQYAAVIPKFIYAIINDEPPIIFGDGNQSRDFTYVDNVVHANILAANCSKELKGEVINIACNKRYTLLELVDLINVMLKKRITPIFDQTRIGDVNHSLASIEKAKEILGYKPLVAFEEGIKKTLELFLGKNSLI